MAGFFSLGAGRQNKAEQEEDQREENVNNAGGNNNSQFLFRNNVSEEIYNKGFEIWPQSSYHHHQNLIVAMRI